jgi:proteasome lid subunit RPN8/RPN11
MTQKKRPERLILSDDLLLDLERHAYSNLDAEVGGMLFGEIVGGNTVIAGSVAATTAAAQQISLTFTHDVWQDILKAGEERFPGKTIVGWYHTHPSFGLFLSEYDQFIQNNFFSNAGQIALVIDPIAGNMGWFEIGPNNKIEMFFQEDTRTGPRAASKEVTEVKNSKSKSVALGASALVIGAAFGWAISLINLPPDQRAVVSQLQLQNDVLYGEVQILSELTGDQQDGRLTFWYSTRTGDTVESLTRQFWGSAGTVNQILDYNQNVKSGAILTAGTSLHIVDAQGYEIRELVVVEQPSPTPTPSPTPSVTPSSAPTKSMSPSSSSTN